MGNPLPVISIDPYKAARISEEVYNALGAPKHISDLEHPRIEHDLKSHFASFAPLYGIISIMPASRSGHWTSVYRAYLERVRLLLRNHITTRQGQRFSEGEKTLLPGNPIPNKHQIDLF
jgi:hypothetical protein